MDGLAPCGAAGRAMTDSLVDGLAPCWVRVGPRLILVVGLIDGWAGTLVVDCGSGLD